jgi:Ca2+-binding EF-hand superfamily protein
MKSKKKLKEELHKLIDSIDDEHTLNVLNEELVPYVKNGTKKVDEDDLTEEQERLLNQAIEEADRGETVSFEEFKKRMDRWRTGLKSTKSLK